MEMTVRVDEGLGPDLYRWLIDDPGVRRHIRVTPVDDAPPGSMGAGCDLLNLIVPNMIALGSLGVSIAAFVDQRRNGGREPRVEAQRETRIVVLGADADEALRGLFQDGLPAGDPPPAGEPSAEEPSAGEPPAGERRPEPGATGER